jgi:hypothetical protein
VSDLKHSLHQIEDQKHEKIKLHHVLRILNLAVVRSKNAKSLTTLPS